MLSYHEIELRVRPLGMRLRGGFYDEDEGRSYLLVGNVGSEIWPIFSKDHNDWNEPHPLDKWTRNKLTPIADEIGALVVFPFDGPEFAPFQKWAMRADCVFPSPVGPLIHPEFGLWHTSTIAAALSALPRCTSQQRI